MDATENKKDKVEPSSPSVTPQNCGNVNNQVLDHSIDPDVFSQLPPDIQEEIMSSNAGQAVQSTAATDVVSTEPAANVRKRKSPVDDEGTNCDAGEECPDGWDAEVFSSLPPEVKEELLANNRRQSQAQRNGNSSSAKKE